MACLVAKTFARSVAFGCGLAGLSLFQFSAPGASPAVDGLDFFEKKIRPLLAGKCYKCHSAEAEKLKGGLYLDSREGWQKGGDTGPALVPGDPEKSLLVKAVRYTDEDLKMPPKQKLADEQIADLEKWVKLGASDPRTAPLVEVPKKQVGLSIEEGRKFWAFQPPKKSLLPQVKNKSWPQSNIDRFILTRLEERGLQPALVADHATLIRRAYFDLTGLPPTPEQIDAFVRDQRPDAFARVVDELLASPHFGERWGRHWLDVARFAESSGGGRTLLFKDAWRYRDYVIEAFNSDVPFDRFIVEQVAGDLLPYANPEQRRRQLIATAFLALGPTNYEEQDKPALRMDIVDEQLDTVGKAFLGLTIGCARCHDHKFDPIPTRDYYALAGIFRSTRTLFNYSDNVARWIETPLPLDAQAEAALQAHEAEIAVMQEQLKLAKAAEKKASANVAKATDTTKGMPVAIEALPGVVVDDTQAKAVGEWKHSQFSRSYIGDGYLHDLNTGKGAKTLTFAPPIKRAGRYEVRLAYIPSSNRATNVPVTVFHADGEQIVHLDERETPPIGGRFVSLGQFRFEKNGEGYVLVSNEGTQGHVVADAVQFIPVEELAADDASAPAPKNGASRQSTTEVKRIEAELKKLTAAGPQRPLAMAVREEDEIGDCRVHIRGSVRNLGDPVPRGFLTVATTQAPAIPPKESGRRQFAEWLASADNPLTARVLANRVWHWLFGAGLVRTTDNFGVTGELPSHPELLDHLAVRFVASGWSVKQLIREIVLSRTYQLSVAADVRRLTSNSDQSQSLLTSAATGHELDPDNRLFSHANRRRLDAESIRDAILIVSGELKLEAGGPNISGSKAINANDSSAGNIEYGYKFEDTRRSVYTPAFRNNRLELFEAFDFGDINKVLGQRNTSTVATQALYLMNHPWVMTQARLAAQRALAGAGLDDATRLERAYRVALGRPPDATERRLALEYVKSPAGEGTADERRLNAWAQFYQTLFACVDFRYVN